MTLFDVSHIRYVINIRNLLFALLILVTFELVTFNPTKCATMGSLFGLCAIKRLHRSGDVKTGWIWSGLRPKSKPPLCPLIPPTIGKMPQPCHVSIKGLNVKESYFIMCCWIILWCKILLLHRRNLLPYLRNLTFQKKPFIRQPEDHVKSCILQGDRNVCFCSINEAKIFKHAY